MLMTWLQSNSTTHWGDGLRFIQIMKNRAYHDGIKCSAYKAMFGQPMKVGLKTSNIPDDVTAAEGLVLKFQEETCEEDNNNNNNNNNNNSFIHTERDFTKSYVI